MLSHAVQGVLAKAVLEMRARKHEYLTSEHILFALTYEHESKIILEGCGSDIGEIRTDIERFFTNNLETVEQVDGNEVFQTVAVERILSRAFQHINSAGRESIEVGDVLAAMFLEEESWSVHILKAQGLSRLDILEYISHRMPEVESTEQEQESQNKQNPNDILAQYCINLNEKVRKNEVDPLVGREAELLRMVEVLARRHKNNPLLVGDAGIGKTAIIQGLAARIVQKKVPKEFHNITLYALDVATLMAGAKYRGEFESRFKAILTEVEKRKDAILVVDEIHSLITSSHGNSGGLDAGNMLKPFLSNAHFRCIGSTTHEEFRSTFNKDRALSRRFQKVDITEPSPEESIAILKGLQQKYEEHHKIRYGKNVLQSIVDLSTRYLQDRMQPDKAIDVMDESAAAFRLKPSFKENSIIKVADIERVIARMANIPTASVTADERDVLKDLEKNLKTLIYGQNIAVEEVTKAIFRSRANFSENIRPTGSFLFYGPTGVGKTELAKTLANQLGISFVRFDMSEYMEKHAVARLIGAPPGYVGFEQGGLLTEAIRKTPHALVLFDEIEKAHPDIYNILLQVMDYATLTDNTGKKTDFRNTIIIMTTNAGAAELSTATVGFAPNQAKDLSHRSKKAVESTFTPEFRNRLDALIPFSELSMENILSIVDKTVSKLFRGLQAKKINLVLDTKAKEWLAKNGFDAKLGARPLERLIRTELEDFLAQESLFGSLVKGGTVKVTAKKENDEHLNLTTEE